MTYENGEQMAELKPDVNWRRWCDALADCDALAEPGVEHANEIDHDAQNDKIGLTEFKNYEEEAAFWDNLDTADMMEDDGKWFHYSTSR